MPLFSLGGCCENAPPANVNSKINAHMNGALVIIYPPYLPPVDQGYFCQILPATWCDNTCSGGSLPGRAARAAWGTAWMASRARVVGQRARAVWPLRWP